MKSLTQNDFEINEPVEVYNSFRGWEPGKVVKRNRGSIRVIDKSGAKTTTIYSRIRKANKPIK